MPHDRLAQGPARHHDQACALRTGPQLQRVAAGQDRQFLRAQRARILALPDLDRAFVGVGEAVVPGRQWMLPGDAGLQVHVQVHRIGGRLHDRPGGIAHLARDHLDLHSRRRLRDRDPVGREFLIARRGRLVARGQVDP